MEGNANNYMGACTSAGAGTPLTAKDLTSGYVKPKDVMHTDDDILKYLDRNIKYCERVISSNPGTFIPLEKLKSICDLIADLKNGKQTTCKDCKWRGTMKVRGRKGQEVYYCKNGYGLQQAILPENYCCMAEKE